MAPAKLAAVIKSNAYGHGIVKVGLALERIASRLCVYSLPEAVALRDAGIIAPILIMGPIAPSELLAAHETGAAIALWDTGGYARQVAAVGRQHAVPFAVHIKLNTGVARLGLAAHRAARAAEEYLRMPGLRVQGVFSHLASAEELDSPFTLGQLQTFETVVARIRPSLKRSQSDPILHIAASAAAMLWPQSRLDMVRAGIALYGLWPSRETKDAMRTSGLHLEPALSFKSQLVATREVSVGTPIGYGASYRTPKDATIGIVPLGYAEGIPRLLSNRANFLVCGQRCPVVGRVCMNMTMIDVSGVPDARSGQQVTLIGTDSAQTVTADDWAQWADTINYEIVTRLPSEVPRRY